MKKALLFTAILLSTISFAQRVIPSGGTYGQVLKVASDNRNLKWSNMIDSLKNLSDVSIPTPYNDQFLRYDSITQKWIASTFSGGSFPINLGAYNPGQFQFDTT